MIAPDVGSEPIVRGDTHQARFTFWADAAKTVPYDLTEAVLAAEVRRETGQPVLAEFVVAFTAPNIVLLTLESDDSALLPYSPTKTLRWDLQATWAGTPPVVHTIASGKLIVAGDVTDSTAAVPGVRSA